MSHPIRSTTLPAGRCPECTHFAPAGGEIGTCNRCSCTRHAAPDARSPYMGHDPETPPGAEALLQALRDALEPARQDLREASDAEVDAELARDAAYRSWILSPDCPKAAGPGRTMTVRERDMWVQDKIVAEERAYRLAKAAREAAKAYLDVLGKQLSAQQSVARSVGDSYRGQRGDGW